MSMRLEGRRALVTGGSRSIGRGIALGLGREGADVVVNFKTDRDAAEEVVGSLKELGRRATAVQGSTDSSEDVNRLVTEGRTSPVCFRTLVTCALAPDPA